jgi:hypothetical protein
MVASAKSPEILLKWGVVMTNSNAPNNFFFEDELANVDPESINIINLEEERQARKIMLIASESICPKPVKEALASVFTNLYAEGYPHMRYIRDERDELLDFERQLAFHRRYSDRRYYKGVDYVNFIEALAQKKMCRAICIQRGFGPKDICQRPATIWCCRKQRCLRGFFRAWRYCNGYGPGFRRPLDTRKRSQPLRKIL